MRVFVCLLTFALSLASCVSYEDYVAAVNDGLKSWQGFHKDELIKTWGAPQATAAVQDGEMLTYSFSGIENYQAAKTVVQLACRYSFQTNQKGVIVDAKASGNAGGCAKFMRVNPSSVPSSVAYTTSGAPPQPSSTGAPPQPSSTGTLPSSSPTAAPLSSAMATTQIPELPPIAGKPKRPRGVWSLKRNLCLDGDPTKIGNTALDQMNQHNGTTIKLDIDFDKKIYTVTGMGCVQKGPFKMSAKGGRILMVSLPGGTGEICPPPGAGVERLLERRGASIYAFVPPNPQICQSGYLVQEFQKVP